RFPDASSRFKIETGCVFIPVQALYSNSVCGTYIAPHPRLFYTLLFIKGVVGYDSSLNTLNSSVFQSSKPIVENSGGIGFIFKPRAPQSWISGAIDIEIPF